MSGHEELKTDTEILGPVWSGISMTPFINNGELDISQIQPNGIDLTVDKVFKLVTEAILSSTKATCEDAELQQYRAAHYHGIQDEGWVLNSGYYVIEWTETVRIPDNVIGLINPRSTLIRSGGTIHGALWDRGCYGKGRSGLMLHNSLLIEQGTRLAQLIFIHATKTNQAYEGRYMHEQLSKDDKKSNNI